MTESTDGTYSRHETGDTRSGDYAQTETAASIAAVVILDCVIPSPPAERFRCIAA